jgi:hypothetical protein
MLFVNKKMQKNWPRYESDKTDCGMSAVGSPFTVNLFRMNPPSAEFTCLGWLATRPIGLVHQR